MLNAEHVEAIDIVWDESLALEGRAGYYDRAGALVDMIQSHLLQVLALLAMRAPASLDPGELRDRKAEILRATRVWTGYAPGWSRRARYTAGEVNGWRVPAYADEDGVDPGRRTETFAEVVFTVDTPRWAGVPFRARSGKALARPRKEAVITFKAPALPAGLTGYTRSDRLRIGFGPDRLCLDLNINGPGDPFAIDPVTLVAATAGLCCRARPALWRSCLDCQIRITGPPRPGRARGSGRRAPLNRGLAGRAGWRACR